MSRTLSQHINDDRNELDDPNVSSQRRRHLEGELDDLQKYQYVKFINAMMSWDESPILSTALLS